MKYMLLFTCLQLSLIGFAQQKMPYQLYDAKGKKVSYKKLIKSIDKQDIVLFGEIHNSAIAHWLQLEVTKEMHTKRSLVLGAEMLEADNQIALDNYISDTITAKQFNEEARLWSNYDTDYKPLVDFAKEKKLSFVATNIPRRYARMVHRNDFVSLDTLPANEKAWIAPLPIPFDAELPRYKNILSMMGDHGSPQLIKAQAIKDATMAHFILENWQPNELFLHFNGAYHSDYYEGILWYLKQQKADLNYLTISTVTQENINELESEYIDVADFVICVDEDMTKTY